MFKLHAIIFITNLFIIPATQTVTEQVLYAIKLACPADDSDKK